MPVAAPFKFVEEMRRAIRSVSTSISSKRDRSPGLVAVGTEPDHFDT
jgi:hypothetical protein